MAKLYCQVTGVVLLVLGVLGFVWQGIPGFLSINERAEIGLHLVLGAIATYVGFSGGNYGRMAVTYAKVFGIVYLVLGLLGFVVPDLPLGIHLDLGCNLAHLVLGIWGVWAGYFATRAGTSPAAA